jgi:hypothetical protein
MNSEGAGEQPAPFFVNCLKSRAGLQPAKEQIYSSFAGISSVQVTLVPNSVNHELAGKGPKTGVSF